MSQTSTMSGWSRALAVILGIFVIAVGFTAIFFPGIVVGFLTVLFSIAFIIMGLWAVSVGVTGQRTTMGPSTGSTSTSGQPR
jgi:uncharacterized membrane protein HdeD (DUF308 family)